MEAFFNRDSNPNWENECKKVAQSFHKFGICIVRDPRVKHEENEQYIDMLERYFEHVGAEYYAGNELADSRPELSFQTGVTPESQEKARDHEAIANRLPEADKPLTMYPQEFDAKWRFFWPIGDRPAEIRNDLPKVIPDNFPEWEERMDSWGNHMIDAAVTAARMAAIGMGLPEETFSEKMEQGSHLLSPTASDLMKYDVGTAFAGFHYDLNFITMHGKSRYPGLFLWTRDWKKMSCKIPQGCLLMQAGIMFEWLTGGYVLGGFHEVVYTEATKRVRDENIRVSQEQGVRKSTWRISSTLFSHLRYNVDISPMPELAHLYDVEEARAKYRPMTAHDKLCEELKAINLAPKQSYCDQAEQASE